MGRSRELDNILNECLERMLQGETLEQCIGRFPERASELKPLLETALVIRQAVSVRPRPEFREDARHRFQAALLGMPHKPRWAFHRRFWQPQWATALAVILAILMAGGGTVAAASASMPDEPLYPVKMAVERTWLVLTPSRLGKAELYAKLTERRTREIARMVDKDKPEKIEEAAKRLDAFLTQVEALSSAEGGQTDQEVEALFSAEQEQAAPGAMSPSQPVGREPLLKRSPHIEKAERDEMDGVIGFDRRARLKARIEYYAANHPARLRALLKNAPESALPALLRAIAVSENGYKKALRSLDND